MESMHQTVGVYVDEYKNSDDLTVLFSKGLRDLLTSEGAEHVQLRVNRATALALIEKLAKALQR